MKRLISVALALVMVLCMFTACGKLVCPVGTYKDNTETSIIELGAYDEKAESGTMKVSNTINAEMNSEGTYTLSDNGGDKTSSIVTYTASNGTVTEFVYDSTMDVMQNIGGGIAYYGANYVEGGAPAAE